MSAPSTEAGTKPGLALFDFDGTLTRRDTVFPFLLEVCGVAITPQLGVAAALGAAKAGGNRRDAAKAAIIRRALAGRAADDVDATGRRYARKVVSDGLRPESRAQLEWHRARGHRLAIVSASLEPYLAVAAEHLGVDTCMCTRLEVDAHGVLTGAMVGANCRGDEKARRVREVLDPAAHEVWAYGDSHGDRALFDLADHPVWVGSSLHQHLRGPGR